MKKQLSILLQLFVVITLVSCANGTSRIAQYKAEPLRNLALDYDVQKIIIQDNRVNTSEEEMKIPILSTPNRYIKHEPALTAEHRTLIANIIKENTNNTGRRVKAVVVVENAYKEFSATWNKEYERGFCQLKVAFYTEDGTQILVERASRGDVLLESADATHKKMEDIYQLALRKGVYNCLKNLNE